jgi:hypothetical protein
MNAYLTKNGANVNRERKHINGGKYTVNLIIKRLTAGYSYTGKHYYGHGA